MSDLYHYDDMSALQVLGLVGKGFEKSLTPELKNKISAFQQQLQEGDYPAFTLALRTEDVAALHVLIENWQKKFKHLVVLGVGGSSLGAQTLACFKGLFASTSFDVHFVDNVDPTTVDDLISHLPLEKTAVLSVSKSGGTLETLAQTSLFMQAFQAQNLNVADHLVGLTEPKSSPLRQLLESEQVPILNHPEEVGGRFTVLTLVGLIPAIAAGVDAVQIRQGAAQVLQSFLANPHQHPAVQGALLATGDKTIQYMMPYSDRLRKMSEWFVQLWAESLGKDGLGTTPVAAVGSTDQHSALQLLMDGPKDKLVTLIVPDCQNQGTAVEPKMAQKAGVDVLAGLTLGRLIYNQAQGTADALTAAGVPVRVFYTPALDEKVLGALLMHFMLETAVAGLVLNVNTWNQPGVEDGKKRTLGYLFTSAN
ncbi:MAG: glucose-6-phosphate isomerase [Magnetococcales bacterium]|nr:glucose-6-phosphate isomerase [Magnetococcales bacterium]|tara:strand:- start:5768 stop:7033 length:1266 start_codon:yes stop_codon:yes gene_type:complete